MKTTRGGGRHEAVGKRLGPGADRSGTGHGPLARHAGGHPHLLQEVMRTSQAVISVFSREVGMTSSRLALLRLLAIGHPAGTGVMAVARELGVNPAAVTRQVRDLEAEGLVVGRADPRDARRRSLSLTPDGLRAFERLHQRGHALERQLRTNVNDEEIAVATRVLGELRRAIEQLR